MMKKSDTKYQPPLDSDAIGGVRHWSEEQPDRIAVRHLDRSLSYGGLTKAMNQVATCLHSEFGKGQENIGILVTRDEFMPAYLLGCWLAGKVYVPLDPALPIGRLQMMLEQANCQGVICSNALLPRIAGLEMAVLLAEDLFQEIEAETVHHIASEDDLAHIIFTSGSTGRPKGVMVSHGNVQSFLSWSIQEFAKTPFKVLLAGTSIAFDLSIFELFLPLILGKEVRILRSNLDLSKALLQEKCAFVNTVPSVIGELLNSGADFSQVVALNMAGEPIPETTVERLRQWPDMAIRNLYGPSECTTYITQYRFGASNTVSIGKVIGDNRLYLLDSEKKPVASGEIGQIYISGSSVSPGYVNDPLATEHAFIADPFMEGKRMYATGDFASENEDGNLLFKGREDDQVKLRGYRIELQEIIRCMAQASGVEQAMAIVRDSGKEAERLVGYYVADHDIQDKDWKGYLGKTLPTYMVPDTFLRLSRFPLNANGKIDKRQLPSPLPHIVFKREKVESLSEKKDQLASIWKSVLGVSNVNDSDHFFELGGHSLKALRLSGRITKEMGVSMHSEDVFRNPSFGELAALIEATQSSDYVPIPKVRSIDSFPLTPAQNQAWLVSKNPETAVSQNIGFALVLKGKLDVLCLKKSIAFLLERHAALRMKFVTLQGQPAQQVVDLSDDFFEQAQTDLVDLLDERAHELLQEEINKPIALSKAPLLKSKLWVMNDEVHVFIIVLHHIVCDGWSVELLLDEWTVIYDALQKHQEPELPSISISFTDYVDWSNERLEGAHGEEMRKHWAHRLSKLRSPAPAVFGESRTQSHAQNGQLIDIALSKHESERFTVIAKESNTGRFGIVVACLTLLIHRYSGLDQVVLGTPVSGRNHPDLEYMVGMFMNMIPLALDLDPQWTFQQLLTHVNGRIQEDLKYQEYPLSFLANNHQTGNQPLFSTGITWQNYEGNLFTKEVGGLEITPIVPKQLFTDRPIWFFGTEFTNRFAVSILYDPSCFESGAVQSIQQHFTQLLAQAAKNPLAKLSQFKLQDQKHEQVKNSIDFQFDF